MVDGAAKMTAKIIVDSSLCFLPPGLGPDIGAALALNTGVPIIRFLPDCYEPSATNDVVKSDNFCNLLQKLVT